MLKLSQTRIKPVQLRLIRDFATDLAQAGVNIFVYDFELNLIININGEKFISDYEKSADFAKQIFNSQSNSIQIADKPLMLGCGLRIGGQMAFAVVIDCGDNLQIQSQSLIFLNQTINIFLKSFHDDIKNSQQIELISGELAQTYEELMLLYKISTNMRVSQCDSNFLQLACDNLIGLVNVEGIAMFLEKKINDVKKLVLTAGTGLIAIDAKNENMCQVLFERLLDELTAGRDAMIDNESQRPFKNEWTARARNIIAVPLLANSKTIGMMVATNLLEKTDFDKNDIKLFNAVASECAIFIENQNLFNDLKELLIGSLKALVNSIDAKDPYTRGHSDRVAIISKWIAEQYARTEKISQQEIQKIYLAGLLHDIGKIGVSESVLKKPGKLTAEEYNEIKTHPTIGAGILSEIHQMSDIIPGILYHHERYDGAGYPNGLAGDDIPLAGKIVVIADSFDAMTSQRTYRQALTLDEAINEVEVNLGKQFDPIIGSMFLKSNIEKLWEILQTGQNSDSFAENINEFGAAAVGSLVR